MTIGPVLTWDNVRIKQHLDALLELEGAKVLFGGKPLMGHSIPARYGSWEPTAVYVPLKHFRGQKKLKLITTEVFGPFQVVTDYNMASFQTVIQAINSLEHHLTAGVVSNDAQFVREVVANTINGVTYTGRRARTTGAPQNHWFGPCGDPRAAGIGTAEAIKLVWSGHREVISDIGPCAEDFKMPKPT